MDTNSNGKILKCLVAVHQTLSICSKCLECCDDDEKELYQDLSEDAAIMIKKLNKAMKQN